MPTYTSNLFSARINQVSNPTVLSQAASSLTAGNSVLPAIPQFTCAVVNQFNWQSRWHYDPVRKKAVAVGKYQQQKNNIGVAEYDELTNTWVYQNYTWPPTVRGHSWEMPCYNRADGYVYNIANGGQTDRVRYRQIGTSLTTWTDLVSTTAGGASTSILYSGGPNFCSGSMAMEYHPNLYGAGSPGLVLLCEKGILGYRFSNDTYTTILSHTADTTDRNGALYCTGLDAVFAYRQNIGQWKITPGPTVTAINAPPVRFCHDTGSETGGKMVDDPNQGSTFYAFQYFGGNNIWKYNSVTDSFSIIDTHDISTSDADNENFIVAAIYGYGVVAIMEEQGTNQRIRLYKPAS